MKNRQPLKDELLGSGRIQHADELAAKDERTALQVWLIYYIRQVHQTKNQLWPYLSHQGQGTQLARRGAGCR
jgi:hypothetical protein